MITLDHVGFAVADYQRSKAFYEKALAPLGLKLTMEFSEAGGGVRQGWRKTVAVHRSPWRAGAWAAPHLAESGEQDASGCLSRCSD